MPRKRMISPEFWSDQKVGNFDFPEQCLFIGMWNFADDEGLIRYSASYLRGCIFPYKDIPLEQIEGWKSTLESAGLVFHYTIDRQEYAWIVNFRIHQVINKPQPSKLPPPSLQNQRFRRSIYHRDKYTCHLCGGTTDTQARVNRCFSKAPSLDHLIPLSKGGTSYPSNLKTACLHCNKTRSNQDLPFPTPLPESSGNTTVPVEANIKEENIKEKKDADAPDPRVREISLTLEGVRGHISPSYGQEAKAIKWMLRFYESQQILDCYAALKKDPFWREKHLDMMSVKKQIGAWLKPARDKSSELPDI